MRVLQAEAALEVELAQVVLLDREEREVEGVVGHDEGLLAHRLEVALAEPEAESGFGEQLEN